ncbi:homoserine dehydrogenase [Aggregatilinea lenta]|uniref:homoserine dehydrogenase n=1 Tax=Aggregatilinea lenta TaxID=913108 RepID=UPI000E5B429D|nr:homoserine dehydrogenase [Aggregatilinea lenta]
MHFDIALLGFGNVARALARLLDVKAATLRDDYDITFRVTGIATQSRGCAIDPDGLDLQAALRAVEAGERLETLHKGAPVSDTLAFIDACPADLIMEATWLNPQTGQPATDYVRAALKAGHHVVTANKGPVAFAYRELRALAAEQGVGFFFESTVMDGAPVLSVGREGLLATTILRIQGILNSTTNYILSALEQGTDFDEAVRQAQAIGVAEADPANDLEGWDATVKTVVLANVLMGADLRPADVDRTGIMGITVQDTQAALEADERIKLLCEVVNENGVVSASVRPARLPLSDPLSQVSKTSSAVTFKTDTLHSLTIVEGDTDPTTTAYGMLVDMINIARNRYHDS